MRSALAALRTPLPSQVAAMNVVTVKCIQAQQRMAPSIRASPASAAPRGSSGGSKSSSSDDSGTSGGSGMLAAFLWPITVEQFMQSHWQQHALHLSLASASAGGGGGGRGAAAASSAADRMAYVKHTYLCDLDVDGLLENTASESIFVWLQQKKALESSHGSASSGSNGVASSAPSSSSTLHSFELDASNPGHLVAARQLHSSGASLYFRSPPPMVDEYVRCFAADLGLDFGAVEPHSQSVRGSRQHGSGSTAPTVQKGEIEVFLSRAGHVTDWHFDFQENFTLQLKGSKTWHLKRSGIAQPIRGATPHYAKSADNDTAEEQQVKVHSLQDANFSWQQRPRMRSQPSAIPTNEQDAYDTVVLREGDCFYHPAGIWHRVECTEDSVSVNISLVSTDWATQVLEGVKQKLWTDAAAGAGGSAPAHSGAFWRQGVRLSSLASARAELSQHLSELRSVVSSLLAEDYLPPSLLLPRQTYYALTNLACDDEEARALMAGVTRRDASQAQAKTPTAKGGKKGKQHSAGSAASAPAAAAAAASSSAAAAPAFADLPLSFDDFLSSSAAKVAEARFRVNPLFVLIAFQSHSKDADDDDDEEEEEGDEQEQGEGDDEEQHEEDAADEADDDERDEENEDEDDEPATKRLGKKASKRKRAHAAAASSSSSSSAAAAAAAAAASAPAAASSDLHGYLLHFSFGNDSLESSVRVAFDVAPAFVPAVELLRRVIMQEKRGDFLWSEMAALVGQRSANAGNEVDGAEGISGSSEAAKTIGNKRRKVVAAAPAVASASAVVPEQRTALRKLLFFFCHQGVIQLLAP